MNAMELITVLNQVPGNTEIMSDSGWEVCASDCSRAFYNEEQEALVLTQHSHHKIYNGEDWKEIFPREEKAENEKSDGIL